MRVTMTVSSDFLNLVRHRTQGRLKVYIGSAAGVGKTYRMLQEAHELRQRGVDVVIGFVETHGRTDTAAQIADLEVVPRKRIAYRSVVLEEMDLDAVVARHPDVVLVDELAHTNVPGAGHGKRWEDVLDILGAGINVISAVNVQHLESLNDVVQRTLGVNVRETVPDWLLARADQVINIDLTAEDLRQRLVEGKIYGREKIPTALENFFTEENVTTLRELALREVASSVDRVREDIARRETGRSAMAHKTADRILVAMASRPPRTATLLRKASRIAGRLNSDWYCVYVQTPDERADRIDTAVQRELVENIQMAQRLGAEVVKLEGTNVAEAIGRFARDHGVSLVLVGQSRRSAWHRLRHGSVVERLIDNPYGLDVQVVAFDDDASASKPRAFDRPHGVAALAPPDPAPGVTTTPAARRAPRNGASIDADTAVVSPTREGSGRHSASKRRARDAETKAAEYAQLLADAVTAMSARLEEAQLPLHILLSSPFGDLNENQEEMLGAAAHAVDAADADLKRLRKLIELDRGEHPVAPERIAVRELLHAPLAIAKARAAGSAIRIVVDLPDTLPRVIADPVHTQEALTALLCETLSHVAAGSELTVRAGDDSPGRVVVTIAPISPVPVEALDVRLAKRVLERENGRVIDAEDVRRVELPADRL